MKVVVLCVMFIAAVCATDYLQEQYHDFTVKYPHHAGSFEAFKQNIKYIEEHNSRSGASFQLGINEYSAMTHEEFVKAKLSTPSSFAHYGSYEEVNAPSSTAPTSLDYRTSKTPIIVPDVRNSGACANSAAFSIVDSIAGDYAVSSKQDVVDFDPAYVTDCDGGGCNGQNTNVIWNFLVKYGLNWYYNGCPTGPGLGLCLTGYNCTKSGSESELVDAVAKWGPIPVGIDASRSSFQLYKNGIYYDASCSSSQTNHMLLIVGYGSSNGNDYWIARNSWGTSWGQNGDVLLARNKNNACGVATNACYAKNVRTCVCEL
jgi:hypothetical protein